MESKSPFSFFRRATDPYEFDVLATYNSEVARGIVHTPEWKAKMASEQQRFDQRTLHVDLVRKDWGSLREELQERIPADDPRAEHAGSDGDYARYSEPHTTEECPWT